MDRYRDRYGPSGAKSDAADALVLAHLLRTDRNRHRPMPADSDQVTAPGVLARAHQDSVRAAVSDAARLRLLLREYFPSRWLAGTRRGVPRTEPARMRAAFTTSPVRQPPAVEAELDAHFSSTRTPRSCALCPDSA